MIDIALSLIPENEIDFNIENTPYNETDRIELEAIQNEQP
jgi:hypothetical protein